MVKVIQNDEKPIEREVLAEAIVRIGDAMKRLNASGLNRRAIIALINDDTKMGKGTIECVLDSLSTLSSTYCKK